MVLASLVEVLLMGRTGTVPVAEEVVVIMLVETTVVVDDGGIGAQELAAQTRSVGQQPPPRDAGQDWTFKGHAEVLDVAEVMVLSDVLVMVEGSAPMAVIVWVMTAVTIRLEFSAPIILLDVILTGT